MTQSFPTRRSSDLIAMLTLLFFVFLLTNIFLHLWLASRQARHVRGHRAQTPAEFSGRIELCSHQRAADYTLAKIRLLIVEQFVDALLLIGLPLLGGKIGIASCGDRVGQYV